MARREVSRLVMGIAMADSDLSFRDGSAASPVADDRGPTTLWPSLAAVGGLGPLVVGLALGSEREARRFAAPTTGQPAADVARLFPYRYAGLASELARQTATAGVAARAGDWLAVGVSASASWLTVSETRRIWAGFSGREPIADPTRDVLLRLDARTDRAWSASLGLLLAPPETPIELAASGQWNSETDLRGTAAASSGTGAAFPQVLSIAPTAATTLPQSFSLRAGARWLGQRWAAELGGEAIILPDPALPTWTIDGLGVQDQSGAMTVVSAVPSRLRRRSRTRLGVAIDRELVAGFLWFTAGYAWTSAGTTASDQNTAFSDLGGHTTALGVDVTAGRLAATLGWSHLFATRRAALPGHVDLDNPFGAGTAPANTGSYDGHRDVVSLTIEMTWP